MSRDADWWFTVLVVELFLLGFVVTHLWFQPGEVERYLFVSYLGVIVGLGADLLLMMNLLLFSIITGEFGVEEKQVHLKIDEEGRETEWTIEVDINSDRAEQRARRFIDQADSRQLRKTEMHLSGENPDFDEKVIDLDRKITLEREGDIYEATLQLGNVKWYTRFWEDQQVIDLILPMLDDDQQKRFLTYLL